MCLGIPARVIGHEDGDLVRVEVEGAPRLVNVGLLDDLPPVGTWVLTHLGFALSTMTEQEATAARATLLDLAAERTGTIRQEAPW